MTALLTTLCIVMATPSATPPDTVVVCPPVFRQTLAPWVKYREQQGHKLRIVSSEGTAEDVRDRIRKVAKEGNLKNILIVGDADPAMETDPQVRARSVPIHFAEAKVNIHWGKEKDIPTDNWYADLDDDHLPDVAIGRLPVDSPEELKLVLGKIFAHEQDADQGGWRRRVNFVAGMGGFSPLADSVLESSAKQMITEGIPAGYDVSMTYGSWRSAYCPDPRLFHDAAFARFNEGSLFWVYIGHGQRHELDRVKVPGNQFHIFANEDVPKLNCEHGPPIAIFLACYTCALDHPRDSLGEELLRRQGGPVAVMGGTRVTMPYAMSVMATELLSECFGKRCETLGEIILHAKRAMVESPRSDPQSRAIDQMARTLNSKSTDLKAERAENVLVFNLLGDPLLRLQYPQDATVSTLSAADAGSVIEVTGTSPIDGPCEVDLCVRRDRLRMRPPVRARYQEADSALAAYQPIYERANDRRWVTVTTEVRDGKYTARLAVPREAHGACCVRAFVSGKEGVALGAQEIEIRRAAAPEPDPATGAATTGGSAS
ncbi:MAG: hypothetical protein KF708_10720 [Pirellulales bacterium]|nr:hypothetical protein [Pirellulales bacterium]